MQGASRDSLALLREQVPTDGDLTTLSQELFAVVSLLSGYGSLRRAMSDPASAPTTKVHLVEQLFGDKVGPQTLELLRAAARSRWSQPIDLLDALEELGVDAALAVAQNADQLDEVDDELFRFGRILEADLDLRTVLTDRQLPAETKSRLLHTLLDGKVTAVTFELLQRAVNEPRGRTIEHALRELSVLAARRREQLIAHVTSAVALSDDEVRDLSAALMRTFGYDIQIQAVVDPSLIGGVTVRVGDEIIDGSVARQLDEARRRLTGRSGTRPNRAA
ncbi:MAG TPA: F0F1 ATP synthase subunit delta [Mycobacteriales bacterium]|nr:F0F1 ATP synthase subunit delta [Mycobacteriales bacterium]